MVAADSTIKINQLTANKNSKIFQSLKDQKRSSSAQNNWVNPNFQELQPKQSLKFKTIDKETEDCTRQKLLRHDYECIFNGQVQSARDASNLDAPRPLLRTQSFSGIGFKRKPMISASQMLQSSISRQQMETIIMKNSQNVKLSSKPHTPAPLTTRAPIVKLGQQTARIPDLIKRPAARKHTSTQQQGLTTQSISKNKGQSHERNLEKWKKIFEQPTTPSCASETDKRARVKSGGLTTRCISDSSVQTSDLGDRPSSPKYKETHETLQTAHGFPFRRQVLIKDTDKLTAYDKTVKLRKPSFRIDKNVVSKPKVFDAQKTIVQMTPLQTKIEKKKQDENKQRKMQLDAKYADLEQIQMALIDDCQQQLMNKHFLAADRLRYLKESIADIKEKHKQSAKSFQLKIPDYTDRVRQIKLQVQQEIAGRPESFTQKIIKKMYLLEDTARQEARAEGPFQSEYDNAREARLQKLLQVAKNVLYFKIKPGEDCSNIIPTDCYSRKGSMEFFRVVKRNELSEVRYLLAGDRFLVYQHNEIRQTPLHICAKRNLVEMAQLLIRFKSDVNARDTMGKTPLYYAVINQYKELVTVLIANMSSCWTTDAQGNNLLQITIDPIIKLIVSKGKEYQMLNKFTARIKDAKQKRDRSAGVQGLDTVSAERLDHKDFGQNFFAKRVVQKNP